MRGSVSVTSCRNSTSLAMLLLEIAKQIHKRKRETQAGVESCVNTTKYDLFVSPQGQRKARIYFMNSYAHIYTKGVAALRES